jgi:hypothetical protein
MKKIILYFLLCGSILDAEDFRKWTSKDGRIIDAKFIKFFEEKVEIQRKDGRNFKIDKSAFSEKDIEYLGDLLKRTDSRGYLWDDSSTRFEITSEEWTDSPANLKPRYFYTFKRDRVDLDGNGEIDGQAVFIKWSTGKNLKSYAWDVLPDGHLILKYKSYKIHSGKYKYNLESKIFEKTEGFGPSILRRANR